MIFHAVDAILKDEDINDILQMCTTTRNTQSHYILPLVAIVDRYFVPEARDALELMDKK